MNLFSDADRTRLTSLVGEKVGTTDWMAPWASIKKRLDDIGPSFDVFPLGKVLWSMLSGERVLPFWWWQEEDYNLQRFFPDDPNMALVNSEILKRTVVEKESDCMTSAEELLAAVARGVEPN